MRSRSCAFMTFFSVVFMVIPTWAPADTFVEDFTTTDFRDPVNTTAWWDTVAGELKMSPFAPTLAGSYNTPNDARGVVASGDHLYVAHGSAGFLVLDISDPASPTFAGSCGTRYAADMLEISGDHAYVADADSGLQVVDISDPTNPFLASGCSTQGRAVDVCVSGDHAYVVTGWPGILGLHVIDISDPANPVSAGSYEPLASPGGIFISGNHVYVANGNAGLFVLDVHDPTNPALTGSCDTPGSASGVFVAGDHAYVADWSAGFQVIDINDPTNPTVVGSFVTSDHAIGVFVSGDHAYLANADQGLRVIDISDPTSPILAGSYNTPGFAARVVVSGDHAYVADDNAGLVVIDVSDPTNPILAGICDTPGWTYDVSVSGDHAFVADMTRGLRVIDISDPTSPILGESYSALSATNGVFVSGNHAYVTDLNSGFHALWVYAGGPFKAPLSQGQSVVVNLRDMEVLRARINTTQVGNVTWQISNNSGSTWQDAIPDGSWNVFSLLDSELVWRSKHTYEYDEVNPACSELELGFLYEPGLIDALVDVPDDQGGWLRLHFMRSGYDLADEDVYPATGYGIHRRLDGALLRERILTEAARPLSEQNGNPLPVSLDPSCWRILDGRYFLDGDGVAEGRDGFPPGAWELVSWVPALQQDDYIALVPTLGDSTVGGIIWSTYLVTTHTTTPSVWFVSLPDSGYSVDNLAPSVPRNFAWNYPADLTWEESDGDDFNYFTIYGSDYEDLGEYAVLIGYTIGTHYDLSEEEDTYLYYFVTATDFSGNEGEPASLETPADVDAEESLPLAYALRPATPNPFTGKTVLSLDLSEACVTELRVYDVGGRLVRTLVDRTLPAGHHRIVWDSLSECGKEIPPGICFARLRAGEFRATERLVIVR